MGGKGPLACGRCWADVGRKRALRKARFPGLGGGSRLQDNHDGKIPMGGRSCVIRVEAAHRMGVARPTQPPGLMGWLVLGLEAVRIAPQLSCQGVGVGTGLARTRAFSSERGDTPGDTLC
jgi:hypothetical protein